MKEEAKMQNSIRTLFTRSHPPLIALTFPARVVNISIYVKVCRKRVERREVFTHKIVHILLVLLCSSDKARAHLVALQYFCSSQ